jgi:two-component system, sensor histidine kinase FlrB
MDAPLNMPLDAAGLAEAFQVFARASEELTHAYGGLQQQVGVLTERLDLLLEALPAGVVVLDRTGRVEQINRAAVAMLGDALHGCDWQPFAAGVLHTTDTPGEWQLNGQGVEYRVSLSETALDRSGGRIVLIHDVTEAWRMRCTAARHERLAAMGEMVAGLAHQLRTPLASALLYTGHLANTALPPQQRADVAGRAVERLRHLERLIQDMLIFARGEALGRESFSVCELVKELRDTIEPVAARGGVRFESDCSAGTEQIFGNRKEIASALTNLLENALQVLAQGGTVRLAAGVEGAVVAFRVRDNGRGIEPAMQDRLFEPFFTTRADGTGLGLAIARGVARAHGGDIALWSEPGVGSEFTFSLPVMQASSATEPAEA